jgi:virginiamycin B lyase
MSTLVVALTLVGCAGGGRRPAIHEFNLPDKTPGGSTHELTVGPDGNVWVSQQNQEKILRLTPSGKQTYFSLPGAPGPHGIRFDARGRLWVAFQFTDSIAQLDIRGHVLRRYRIPVPRWLKPPPSGPTIGPHGLTIATDGSIWFTGKSGSVIGRLDPDGKPRFHLYRLRAGRQPIYIAQGCDGMYFTELLGSRIGRIRRGRLTEWKTPTPDSRPIAIAVRDCHVWFTEERGAHFGTIRENKLVEYPTRSGQTLAALAFDPIGTLWLSFSSPSVVARVGSDERVTEYRLPTKNATLHRIIAGPGRKMWFTELAADKVGTIAWAP